MAREQILVETTAFSATDPLFVRSYLPMNGVTSGQAEAESDAVGVLNRTALRCNCLYTKNLRLITSARVGSTTGSTTGASGSTPHRTACA